jgi:hypothetical protein
MILYSTQICDTVYGVIVGTGVDHIRSDRQPSICLLLCIYIPSHTHTSVPNIDISISLVTTTTRLRCINLPNPTAHLTTHITHLTSLKIRQRRRIQSHGIHPHLATESPRITIQYNTVSQPPHPYPTPLYRTLQKSGLPPSHPRHHEVQEEIILQPLTRRCVTLSLHLSLSLLSPVTLTLPVISVQVPRLPPIPRRAPASHHPSALPYHEGGSESADRARCLLS